MINPFFRPRSWLLAALVLSCGCLNVPAQSATSDRAAAQHTAIGGDFTLTDQNGGQFRLHEQHGKVVLLFFGYTSCPDACPTMMLKLKSVYQSLGQKQAHVLTAFVSVDPARDTPEALNKYLDYFHIPAVGLTGTREAIDAVVKQYGAFYEIEKSDSAMGYHINHSTTLYVIDQSGTVRSQFKYTDKPNAIAAAVQPLIE